MMFKVDYSKATSLLPEGEYEVYISDARTATTKGGTPYMSLEYTIRDDVEQQNGGWRIHESFFKGRESGAYNIRRIQQLCKCAELPDGEEYPGEEELLSALGGQSLRIVVGHRVSNYSGENEAIVRFYKPSNAERPAIASLTPIDDDNEDLPF